MVKRFQVIWVIPLLLAVIAVFAIMLYLSSITTSTMIIPPETLGGGGSRTYDLGIDDDASTTASIPAPRTVLRSSEMSSR